MEKKKTRSLESKKIEIVNILNQDQTKGKNRDEKQDFLKESEKNFEKYWDEMIDEGNKDENLKLYSNDAIPYIMLFEKIATWGKLKRH